MNPIANAGRFIPAFLRKPRNVLIVFGVTALLYLIFTMAILPLIIKSQAVKNLSEQLDREVSLAKVRFNPFLLTTSIEGLEISDKSPETTLFSVQKIVVDLEISSIWKRALIIKQLTVTEPFCTLIRIDQETLNISDLIQNKDTPEKEQPDESARPFQFSVSNIQITAGRILFKDHPMEKTHEVSNIELGLPVIANTEQFTDIFTEPKLSALVNNTPFEFIGQSKPFQDSLETILDIDLHGIDLPFYATYMPIPAKFVIQSGTLNVDLNLRFRQNKDKTPVLLVEGSTALEDFQVTDPSENPLVTIPHLGIDLASSSIIEQKINIKSITIDNPAFAISRDKAGLFNVVPKDEPVLEKTAVKTEAPTGDGEEKRSALQLYVDSFALTDGKLSFIDESLAESPKLDIDQINVTMQNFGNRNAEETQLSTSMHIGPEGSLQTEGTFFQSPLSLDMALNLERFSLPPMAPYIGEVLALKLLSGEAGVKGNITAKKDPTGMLIASYSGAASLTDFHATDVQDDDLLKWKSLQFIDMTVDNAPTSVVIDNIGLTDFYTKILIRPDGTINLKQLTKSESPDSPTAVMEGAEPGPREEAVTVTEDAPASPINLTSPDASPETTPEAGTSAPQIAINRVTLQGGEIDFTDQSITPRFTLKMLETGGRISGISSDPSVRAEVNLAGKLANQAPLTVTGTINPLAPELHVDLKAAMKNMDLSPLTPYSGKYVGYTIQKGKLFVDTHYAITGTKIDASNSFFLDQFTLGEKVESKDAINVPITLVISLLKDSKGEIHLDLPISGDLANPEFKIGSVIAKVFLNLIIKAVTSPFALLGSIAGGGEELSFQDFDFGSATLPSTEKLDSLSKALIDRPALKIEILGKADGDKDRVAIIEQRLADSVLQEKKRDLKRKGYFSKIETAQVEPAEYEKYLRKAYGRAKFPKPKNKIGFAKKLPVGEMEKLIRTHIEISDDDLLELAAKRAQTVRDYLAKSEQITPERIFMLEPVQVPAGTDQKESSANRVDFSIK